MLDKDLNSTDYPYNLLEEIGIYDMQKNAPPDFEQSLEYVLSGLTDRQRKFIYERYREGKTLSVIGKGEGLSRERIRQIIEKGIRMLSHPSRKNYIVYGVKGMEAKAVREALDKDFQFSLCKLTKISENILKILSPEKSQTAIDSVKDVNYDASIETLNMSVRATVNLKRAGIDTVGKFLECDRKTLFNVENLGRKSMDEISDKLMEYGIKI